MNIIPLVPDDEKISVRLEGLTGVGDIIALTRYLHQLPEHGQTGQTNIT